MHRAWASALPRLIKFPRGLSYEKAIKRLMIVILSPAKHLAFWATGMLH